MAAQVRRQHLEAVREPLFGEPAEAQAVRRDAVQANDRRRVVVAPFVQVEQHQARARAKAGSVSRQSPAMAMSAVPVTGSLELLNTAITAALTEAAA